MDRRTQLAFALIALGLLALLARASGSTGWLWLGIVAAVALVAYRNSRTYGFLVVGAIMAGSAVGLLLTELFRVDGVFLVGLGAGLVAIDRIEPRAQRWSTYLGAVLAAVGLLAGLVDTGVLGSTWLPILLIVLGIALLWRERRGEPGFPPPQRSVSVTSDRMAPTAPETPTEAGPAAQPDTATGPTTGEEPSR